jgi:hypothetical protein
MEKTPSQEEFCCVGDCKGAGYGQEAGSFGARVRENVTAISVFTSSDHFTLLCDIQVLSCGIHKVM